jgi:hypothetical protein
MVFSTFVSTRGLMRIVPGWPRRTAEKLRIEAPLEADGA